MNLINLKKSFSKFSSFFLCLALTTLFFGCNKQNQEEKLPDEGVQMDEENNMNLQPKSITAEEKSEPIPLGKRTSSLFKKLLENNENDIKLELSCNDAESGEQLKINISKYKNYIATTFLDSSEKYLIHVYNGEEDTLFEVNKEDKSYYKTDHGDLYDIYYILEETSINEYINDGPDGIEEDSVNNGEKLLSEEKFELCSFLYEKDSNIPTYIDIHRTLSPLFKIENISSDVDVNLFNIFDTYDKK